MRERFEHYTFQYASLEIIRHADSIIAEYQAAGYTLTLRQLYYQFVSRDLITNTQKSYDRLGRIVSRARLAGLLDWSAIEDRTRNLRGINTLDSPEDAMFQAADRYALDAWEKQPARVEVWIEKDALVGVIQRVCNEHRVDYFACRGYVSQSEQYRAGKRFERYHRQGQSPIVIHLGDHDPSGVDMTRDNRDRLAMFAGVGVEVRRIALNYNQVLEYEPPPNPAKLSDSRAPDYIANYGRESWELDALRPQVIDELIRAEIETILDRDLFESRLELEREHKERIRELAGAI